MIIRKITPYLVRPRWCFVEIETDDGLSGWGEAVLEGHASTVRACVEEMTAYLGKIPCGLRISGLRRIAQGFIAAAAC